jgi:hypothetical protein
MFRAHINIFLINIVIFNGFSIGSNHELRLIIIFICQKNKLLLLLLLK